MIKPMGIDHIVLRVRKLDAAPAAEGRNVDHLALRIADCDEAALRQYLGAAGVSLGEASSRYGAEGEGPSLYITDPDGNTVELEGPAWPEASDAAV